MIRTLLFGLLVLVLLSSNRVVGPTYSRDAGIFSYIGEQILMGRTLYVDAWDSKGPLIFYLYALGIAMGGQSGWGIWVIHVLIVASATLFGYAALRPHFGKIAAGFGTWVWVLTLFMLGGGLNVELASLPFQFAALYFYTRWQRGVFKYGILIGVAAACAFLSRANNVGTFVGIAALVLFDLITARPGHRAVQKLAAMGVGASITLSSVAIYFARMNALMEMIDAAIIYNLSYSNTSLWRRAISIFNGFRSLNVSMLILGLGIILASAKSMRSRLSANQASILAVGVVDLTAQLFLSTLSGRNYSHYYISLLPALAVFATLFAFALMNGSDEFGEQMGRLANRLAARFSLMSASLMYLVAHSRAIRPILILQLLAILVFANSATLRIGRTMRVLSSEFPDPVTRYIVAHTASSDYLLMWSAEIYYNYVTGRPSPSRYAHQYPLFTQGYQRKAMVDELLSNLKEKKPLIIDGSITDSLSPSIDDEARINWVPRANNWGLLPEMDAVFSFIHAHYQRVAVIGPNQWAVYRYVGAR